MMSWYDCGHAGPGLMPAWTTLYAPVNGFAAGFKRHKGRIEAADCKCLSRLLRPHASGFAVQPKGYLGALAGLPVLARYYAVAPCRWFTDLLFQQRVVRVVLQSWLLIGASGRRSAGLYECAGSKVSCCGMCHGVTRLAESSSTIEFYLASEAAILAGTARGWSVTDWYSDFARVVTGVVDGVQQSALVALQIGCCSLLSGRCCRHARANRYRCASIQRPCLCSRWRQWKHQPAPGHHRECQRVIRHHKARNRPIGNCSKRVRAMRTHFYRAIGQ